MPLKLSDLVEISNNSIITSNVLRAINSSFTEKEIRDFKQWLKIVEQTLKEVKSPNYMR